MKQKLQSIIATIVVLAISSSVIYGQANLTFSGGNGTPLQITLQQSVRYTTTNSNCVGVANGPIFLIDEVGNLLSGYREVTGTMTYSINGGAGQLIDSAITGSTQNDITINDLRLFSLNRPGVSSGDIVVLSAGTVITTGFNVAGAPPASGSFTTFLTNQNGIRCSENGVALGTTAAPVSISGKVLINNGRGLSNALVYLTDQGGKSQMVRTNAFGHYRFADVEAGQSATVTVVSKRYQFAPKVVSLNDSATGLDFIAEQ